MSSIPAILLAATVAAPAGAPSGIMCSPQVKWTWDGAVRSPAYPLACVTPLVVELTDDNGDGRIDASDAPDVVFAHAAVAGLRSRITALDGRDGRELFTTTTPEVFLTALAAGDLDGDGVVEIVALNADNRRPVAFDHTGALLWTGDTTPAPSELTSSEPLGIADLDRDGSPEIYVGATVFGADGSFRWQSTTNGRGLCSFFGIRISNALELLSANPGLELLAGNTVYDARGSVVWKNTTLPDGWTAPADFDGDGRAEIILTDVKTVRVLDDGGMLLGTPYVVTTSARWLSQPLVADVDGDGSPEVVVASDSEILALEWDGSRFTRKWTQPTKDLTRIAGASAFDFDGDGAAEVLYHDEESWFILDGRNGAVHSRIPYASATGIEVPVVADIDGDCSPEILVSGCGLTAPALNQVIAYSCVGSAGTRPVWNQYNYHATNVDDDGRIPWDEQPSWTTPARGWMAQITKSGGTLPSDLGNSLRAVQQVFAVELTWAEDAGAASYALYRDTRKGKWSSEPWGVSEPRASLADVRPFLSTLFFYRVAGVSCSGQEGP